MSAIVCGKRSFFEDPTSPSSASPSLSKRIRLSSPVRFAVSPSPSPFDQLRAQFPDVDTQLIEKALEECGSNLCAAVKSLNELWLGHTQVQSGGDDEVNQNMQNGSRSNAGVTQPSEDPALQCNLPVDGSGWVELLLKEMLSATSTDDAKARAARVLESLEKSIRSHVAADSVQNIQKENMMLKEQNESLLRDNAILKRAVAIQHERQKEYDDKNQEAEYLKQVVSQYQQQVTTLEVNNYALKMHLQQAEQGNSIPGRFHPDVF